MKYLIYIGNLLVLLILFASIQIIKSDFAKEIYVNSSILSRAGHSSVINNGFMYIYGGYNSNQLLPDNQLFLKYNIEEKLWFSLPIPQNCASCQLTFHTMNVLKNDWLVLFGGFNDYRASHVILYYYIPLNKWEQSESFDRIVPVAGHTSHIIGSTLYILFGYNDIYGYMNLLQKCNLENKFCQEISPRGIPMHGLFGHTSVYDNQTDSIFIHGGLTTAFYPKKSSPNIFHNFYNQFNIKSGIQLVSTNLMYRLDVSDLKWYTMKSNDDITNIYFHKMVIIKDYLYVIGGIKYGNFKESEECYELHNYKIYTNKDCAYWQIQESITSISLNRFGHSSSVYKGNIYIFGGYDIYATNKLIKITLDKKTDSNFINKFCLNLQSVNCTELKSCEVCVTAAEQCVWCNKMCQLESKCNSTESTQETISFSEDVSHVYTTKFECIYGSMDLSYCVNIHNCNLCYTRRDCVWNDESMICQSKSRSYMKSIIEKVYGNNYYDRCHTPCSSFQFEIQCNSSPYCRWCQDFRICLAINGIASALPFGQCPEIQKDKLTCMGLQCKLANNCRDCLNIDSCLWCTDKSNTGRGKCLIAASNHITNFCVKELSMTDKCPLCQCNGHSACHNSTNICANCTGYTIGSNCHECVKSYYGNPTNGGLCKKCACVNNSQMCDKHSGQCYCSTRGEIGANCDICDISRKYVRDNTIKSSCYYEVISDYKYSFHIGPDDYFITRINFKNYPKMTENDVSVKVKCTIDAKLNVTYVSGFKKTEVVSKAKCSNFIIKLKASDIFTEYENTTFYVHVFDFNAPIKISVTFNQLPGVDLIQFFTTFFGCVISLLLFASIAWKMKKFYDEFHLNRRMVIELTQMARRPYAKCQIDKNIAIHSKESVNSDKGSKSSKKKYIEERSILAVEPSAITNKAICTSIIQLPNGGIENKDDQQAILIFGSTVVDTEKKEKNKFLNLVTKYKHPHRKSRIGNDSERT
ncbi:hypothetical protein A3Q56_00872 [Intoshia linei]|uniref:Laminin EGF-like domain-containing protein n=1 Tax=Intoshia linei TaxID=1819745 RepID=A0A177BCL8_9BILA|nr:hypothetical protein A3Q56_00872 [Intoshia linei]